MVFLVQFILRMRLIFSLFLLQKGLLVKDDYELTDTGHNTNQLNLSD
jgi:hypothetical protein